MRRLLFPLAALLFACAPPVLDYEPPCDACGVCDDDRTNDCVVDCNGDPGGTAVVDDCGVCTGGKTDKSACEQDCAGVFGGTARLDDCGECTGGSTGQLACGVDCADVKGGTAWVDRCGACVGGTTEKEACEADCAGTFGGTASLDECGNCTGGDTGIPPCAFDCAGVPNGSATTDACGVCDDDPTNDCVIDCHGVPDGPARLDACGVCDADPGNDCPVDCAGVGNGTARLDNCGICVGGTTGLTACKQDCSGTWGGGAAIDRCGVCSGGQTGIEPCAMWCEPFARSLAKSGHAYEGDLRYFKENVPTDESWYGMEDQAVGSLSWLEFNSPLSLPPGTWRVRWKLAPGKIARDVRLSVRPAVEKNPCVAFQEIFWMAGEQSKTGDYSVSPAVEFKVEGERLCPIWARVLSEPNSVSGYRLDWVRATPMCDTADQCPTVPGVKVSCAEEEKECRYDSKDSDGDGFCDAIDVCPEGDDRSDTDGDEFPDECDCDLKQRGINPRSPELCGGGDNNCNGLDVKQEAAGTRMVSLVHAEHAPEGALDIKRGNESPFGEFLTFDGVTELSVHGGAPVVLNPGRYGVTYRVRPLRWRFDKSLFGVSSGAVVPCVDGMDVTWPGDFSEEWVETPMAEFKVSSFDCPVTPRIVAPPGGSSTGALDSMTIVGLCSVAEDCAAYRDHRAICKEGICRYESALEVCEP